MENHYFSVFGFFRTFEKHFPQNTQKDQVFLRHSHEKLARDSLCSHTDRVTILTYGIESIHIISQDEKRQLKGANNSRFRKIFRLKWSKSITALQGQGFLNRSAWEQLVDKRIASLTTRIAGHSPANALSGPLLFQLLTCQSSRERFRSMN